MYHTNITDIYCLFCLSGAIAPSQLRTAETSVPMEEGVGGTFQPINADEDNRMVSSAEALRHFRSQVSCLTPAKDGTNHNSSCIAMVHPLVCSAFFLL